MEEDETSGPLKEVKRLNRQNYVLQSINKGAHFSWINVLSKDYSNSKVKELVIKYWMDVGHETAEAYMTKMDIGLPVPERGKK